jgi:hypothetical protein
MWSSRANRVIPFLTKIPKKAFLVYKERDRKYGWKHCYRRLPLGLRVVLQSACADTVNAAAMAFVV